VTGLHIRADASRAMGLGHVLRCTAVAEVAAGWGLDVRFVVAGDGVGPSALAGRGFAVDEIEGGDLSWLASVRAEDAVLIDGHHLVDVAAAARSRGARVGVIDDADGAHPDAHVVVCADRLATSDSPKDPASRRLAGPAHALVRREFRDHRGQGVDPPTAVLTAVGGTDPGDRLAAVALAVSARLPDLPVRPLRTAAADAGGVAAALVAAGSAVSAVGTSAWELLCVGVPAALVVAAEDQHDPARLIADAGAALVLGTIEEALAADFAGVEALTDSEGRRRWVEAGLDLVDGRGAERVLDAVLAS